MCQYHWLPGGHAQRRYERYARSCCKGQPLCGGMLLGLSESPSLCGAALCFSVARLGRPESSRCIEGTPESARLLSSPRAAQTRRRARLVARQVLQPTELCSGSPPVYTQPIRLVCRCWLTQFSLTG